MTHRTLRRLALAAVSLIGAAAPAFGQTPQNPPRQPVVGRTLAESVEGQRPTPLRPREGAPNILWILLDDAGFGASSSFGGIVPTPNLDALANRGLRFTNFHTTGVCSPTRAALLTGRNHHRVGMGMFPHDILSVEFPGYTGRLQPQDGTVAEYLRSAGYSTYALGKWHLTPDAELTDLGPFDRWPSGKGFDHFFGFLGGAEDQYRPRLVEDNVNVRPDGRHLNAQLVDKAISYVDRQQQLGPNKPFFMYLAPGATHSPHQVDQQWLDRWRGKFDDGWDVARTRVIEQQRRLGVIPANAQLPPRDPRVPAWNSLNADQKRVYARFMESYAAFLEYTDSELGRLFDHLREKGLLDNTAVFVIIGDNGASKEGGPNGSLVSELTPITRDDRGQVADLVQRLNDIGTGRSYSNYPIGWSQAANTPFRSWKADANTEGGTRNPLIVSWPRGLASANGAVRGQYGHVIDLLPTALELAGVQAPAEYRGVRQDAVQGTSLAYAFGAANAPTRHTVQYHFLFGGGGIVKDGWKASFGYRPDYVDIFSTYPAPSPVPNNAGREVWELYDLNTDFNERVNVAARYPDKLRELQALFRQEAEANNAYPLINWSDVAVRAAAARAQGVGTPAIPQTGAAQGAGR
jgi:arylsulfatase